MKLLRVLVVGILLLPLVLLLVVALALDGIVHNGVTRRASAALGVPVTLSDANASVFGRIGLEGLAVPSPEGFAVPRALVVDRISVHARFSSLVRPVVDVELLRLERPVLSVDLRGLRTNVGALIDRIPPRDQERGRRFRIARVSIEGAVVRLSGDHIGEEPRTLHLPPIELRNVGTAEDAAPMGELASQILRALLEGALRGGTGLPAEALRALERQALEGVEEAVDRATERLDGRMRRGIDGLRRPEAR
jgi:hypothetical protein